MSHADVRSPEEIERQLEDSAIATGRTTARARTPSRCPFAIVMAIDVLGKRRGGRGR